MEEKKTTNEASDVVTAGRTHVSDLWKKEDWLATWIGVIVVAIAFMFVHFDIKVPVGENGNLDFSALKFSTFTVWEGDDVGARRSCVSDKKAIEFAKENINAGKVDTTTVAKINADGKVVCPAKVDAEGNEIAKEKVLDGKSIKKNKELVTDEQVMTVDTTLGAQLNTMFWVKLLFTLVILAILFAIGAKLMGEKVKKYLPAFIALFVLGVLVRLISAEFTLNRYLEWAFWALIVGLLISNTIGVPNWMKPAIKTEFYIKTGLVIMGFSVLFSNIAKFGLYGLGIAWIVTPIVIIFMWYFGTRVLKLQNKPLVMTLAAATSVCGTSAAIATGAAAKAKKTDLSLAVSISIIFTILMMVFEPIILKATSWSPLMGGSLIGGTVDSTGAVVVAGTALGDEAQTAAVLVKSIQNILIGFIAFAVALFFATKVDKTNGQKVGVAEIWYRFPKFIIGFFALSLIASFVVQPLCGGDEVKAINGVLDQYKNWAFVLAFTSIGLDTNFKELAKQMQGGKVLWLYLVGQIFNIVLTAFMVWLLLSGVLFEVPVLD